jgi:hypothetical protein
MPRRSTVLSQPSGLALTDVVPCFDDDMMSRLVADLPAVEAMDGACPNASRLLGPIHLRREIPPLHASGCQRR